MHCIKEEVCRNYGGLFLFDNSLVKSSLQKRTVRHDNPGNLMA